MTPNGFENSDVQRIEGMHHQVQLVHTHTHRADVGRAHNQGPPRLIPPLRPPNDSHTLAHNIKPRHQSSQQPAHTLMQKLRYSGNTQYHVLPTIVKMTKRPAFLHNW